MTFAKVSNPATLPTGTGNGVAWSSGGAHLAVAHSSSPFVTAYSRSGSTFTKLTNPVTLPAGTGNGASWTSDGAYLAVAHTTSPYLTVYSRSGSTLTKLTDPATLPTGTGVGVSWTSDGAYLAVAHITSPFVTVYSRSGSTLTKLSNPATLPVNTGNGGVSWTSDGAYLAVAHDTSPYLTVYSRSGSTLTKITNPDVLPAGTGLGASWLDDGTYLAISHSTSPFVTNYYQSGGSLTRVTKPDTLPASTGRGVAWASDGSYLAVSHNSTPFVTIYAVTSTTPVIKSAASSFKVAGSVTKSVTSTWNVAIPLIAVSSSDTGSFVDDGVAAETTISKSESDTASFVDSGAVTASFSSADVSSSTDSGTLAAGLVEADTSTSIDTELISAVIVSVDDAAGVDTQQSSTDSEALDTSTSIETQSLVVSITADDSLALVDIQDLSSTLTESDDFLATETEILEGGISEYIATDEAFDLYAVSNDDDVYTISDSETLTQTVTDGLSGVIEFEESLTAVITFDEPITVVEDSVISLADFDDFTYAEEQDVAFNIFADDSSPIFDEAEEIHELVFVADDDSVLFDEQMTLIEAILPLTDDNSFSGLDEEFTLATLVEIEEFIAEDDELSAGPTGVEFLDSNEEAWVDVALSSNDDLISNDLELIKLEETDSSTSLETEIVTVSLISTDEHTGLDDSLLISLVDQDDGTSEEIELLEADLISDEPISSDETELTFDVFDDDSLVSSEDLVVIDLVDDDQGSLDEALFALDTQTNDEDFAIVIDDGSSGSSIGDEGDWSEDWSIESMDSNTDSLLVDDLGYVDIPVNELITSIEEFQDLTSFAGDTSLGLDFEQINQSQDQAINLSETESTTSGLPDIELAFSAEAEFLEILASDDLAVQEIEANFDALIFSDDPVSALDEYTIDKVLDHFELEPILVDEAEAFIEMANFDLAFLTDVVSDFGFSDPDLSNGVESASIGQLSIDAGHGLETEMVVVNLFSGDTFNGTEAYVNTELMTNDQVNLNDDSSVFASITELDQLEVIDADEVISLDVLDDCLADEAEIDYSALLMETDDLLTDEAYVSIEAELSTLENYLIIDDQSYFLGDSVSDDEATIDAVEAEEVVWVISDSDDSTSNEAEFKPRIIPQGFSYAELTVMRKLTVFMIKTNPIALALIPEVKIRKDNGSLVYEDGPVRPIQIFRLLPESYQTKPTQIVDGVERVIDYTLLGRWDAQMERGDHWVGTDGKHYKIIELVPYQPYMYEKKGLVECHG